MTRAGSLGGSLALHAAALAALVLLAPRPGPPVLDFTQVRLIPPGALRRPSPPPALGAPVRVAAPAGPRRTPPPVSPLRNPPPQAIPAAADLPPEPSPPEASAAETPPGGEGVSGGAAGGVPGGLPGGVPEGVAGGVPGGVPGGDPLAAPPAAAHARAEWLDRHFARIRDAIQRRAEYPSVARRMGWEGRVVVGFRVLADGRVADLRVVRSSGHRVLDEGALQAVARAAPFPEPPCEAELVIPVSFTLT